MRLADVAIPVPLGKPFSYEVPDALAETAIPGARVLCQFGRRKVLGVIVRVEERPPPEGFTVKPIGAVVDAEPVVPAELLQFLLELARYYFAPIGEVLRLALPAVEREHLKKARSDAGLFDDDALEAKRVVGKRVDRFAVATDQTEVAGTLRGQSLLILRELRAQGRVAVPRLAAAFSNARPSLNRLVNLGLARIEEQQQDTNPFDGMAPVESETAPVLTEPQQAAHLAIGATLRANKEAAFLVFGVTGSGKTEVYLQAIASALALGKGALVLVPEIALTPQLVRRFRSRFGDAVAVLHSGLSESQRHRMWKRLRSAEVKVAIGARSALFAPVPNLGLVVVDEEHDPSFKQEEGVRYHARDMALLRAYRAGGVALLGSATPSTEAFALVEQKRLGLLELPARANVLARLPTVEIVDLKRNPPLTGSMLSVPLHRAIEQTLAAQEQVILFLNRRGFAPSLVCHGCGTVVSCPSCSVSLTLHRSGGEGLRCHYCDFVSPVPRMCPSCDAPRLELEGTGTERLEEGISERFPGARVARLDRDVAGGLKSEVIIERMRQREIDILVGTQMVTKGHDLPEVTLVGVLNADAALSMPDFRASERSFQLLVQVAGRAGRAERPGRVILQTRQPDHPAVVHSAKHDVRGFLAHELAERRETSYPPFSRLTLLRIDAVSEDAARTTAKALAAEARRAAERLGSTVEVLGPSPAPIARVRGRYRFRLMLRGTQRSILRGVASSLIPTIEQAPSDVRVIIDVDPMSML